MKMKKSNITTKKALGYMRISDKKQIKGESKANQKEAIKKYAEANGIEIVRWFYDEAKSGKNAERDELQNLLKTAVKMKGSIDYVIVYKMNRASRDLESYFSGIRTILYSKGIQIRSATEHFDDTPSGHFMEAMHVLVGQLDNENKREAVVDNMTRLAKQGYWQHKPLRGYDRYTIKNGEGKPRPSMIANKEAENVADILLRFNRGDLNVAEMVRYATTNDFLNQFGQPLTQQYMTNMLMCPEYAGYVHDKFTDYQLVKGRHVGIIKAEIYWQNQEILKRKNKAYLQGLKHHEINILVPLRKFMMCVRCGKSMTSSNPGGKQRYYCSRETCRKTGSVTATIAHERFETLLSTIEPKESTMKLMKEILMRTSVKQLGNINTDIANLHNRLDGIATTRSNTIKQFVNGHLSMKDKDELINELDIEKLELSTELEELEEQQTISESSIDYALNYMGNIAKQWSDASLDLKQKFQHLIFPNGFTYDIQSDNFIINKISPLYRCITPEMETDFAKNSSLVTHTSESLHLIKQEGKRWRSILDPMYREYKLQIRSRD